MLLLTNIPVIPAVLVAVGLLELVCTSENAAAVGLGPLGKMALVVGFIVTLLIWLIMSGRRQKEQEQTEAAE